MTNEELEARFNERILLVDSRFAKLEEATKKLDELIEFFDSVKGAFRVLEALGKLAKPLAYLGAMAAAVSGFWASIKGGIK